MRFWQLDAACKDVDPEIFFPETDRDPTRRHRTFSTAELQAVRICQDCPVVAECLQDALKTHVDEDYGIRGGTTRRQRMPMRRQLVSSARIVAPRKEVVYVYNGTRVTSRST
jgi:hypothetical protein